MESDELKAKLGSTAFAFRGYNVTNLGRSSELLAHPDYGPVARECLESATAVCADVTKKPVDLVGRIQRHEEASLENYPEAIAYMEKAFSLAEGFGR